MRGMPFNMRGAGAASGGGGGGGTDLGDAVEWWAGFSFSNVTPIPANSTKIIICPLYPVSCSRDLADTSKVAIDIVKVPGVPNAESPNRIYTTKDEGQFMLDAMISMDVSPNEGATGADSFTVRPSLFIEADGEFSPVGSTSGFSTFNQGSPNQFEHVSRIIFEQPNAFLNYNNPDGFGMFLGLEVTNNAPVDRILFITGGDITIRAKTFTYLDERLKP